MDVVSDAASLGLRQLRALAHLYIDDQVQKEQLSSVFSAT